MASVLGCDHDGPHTLTWFHRPALTNGFGQPLYTYIEAALSCASEGDDYPEVADAVEVVRRLLERATAQDAEQDEPWREGFKVTEEERKAIEIALEDACDYMMANRYDEDEDFPETCSAARILGNGSDTWSCMHLHYIKR